MRFRTTVSLLGFLLLLAANRVDAQGPQTPSREQGNAQTLRPDASFVLTPTQNIWVFLLLDTSNGRVWQLHFSLSDSSFSGRLPLNETPLARGTSARVGRFALQGTQNIFTFLLLDQIDGRVWQLQWSNDQDKRGIVGQISEVVP